MESHLETERKYDASASWEMPDLQNVEGVASVQRDEPIELHAEYFDTRDHVLLRRRVTLRRRTGGADAGWHLKLPAVSGGDNSRLEVRHPLTKRPTKGPPVVPAALVSTIRAFTRGADLVPVATIDTRRSSVLLRAPDGTALAEVADDRVTAVSLAEAPESVEEPRTWHEVEVELIDGSPAILDAVEGTLVGAGAVPSIAASKLARTLGRPTAHPARSEALSPRSMAGAAVAAYLGRHVDRLVAFDPAVRAGGPHAAEEAVHQMRVSTRRLRSCLATYAPLYRPDGVEAVRGELAWIGGQLGGLRDVQVIRMHLLAAVDELTPEDVHGPIRDRLDAMLSQTAIAAHHSLLEALDTERYFRLLGVLDDFVKSPPLTSLAFRQAGVVVPRRVRSEWNRVTARHRDAVRADDPAQRDTALHALRRAAKRARYAAEVAVPVCGDPAERFAGRMSEIQTSLGDHQDTVIVRRTLLDAARLASQNHEDAFTYGLLVGLQQARAEASVREFERIWKLAASRRSVRWLG